MNILSTNQLVNILKNDHQPLEYHFSMNKTPKSIMITGANGFLAQQLISKLISLVEVETIYCLVRDISNFSLSHSKIHPIKYLGLESFELNNHDIDDYLNKTDCFIHCAAQVHNIKSVNSLYQSNINFSYQILNKIKDMKLSLSFHLISTLSVYASSANGLDKYEHNQFEKEDAPNQLIIPNDNHKIIGGYAQSKWLSEYLFSNTNAHIIRLGLLTPDYHNPKFNENEFLTMLTQLIIKTGAIPFESDEEYYHISKNTLVDITPVNFAAQFISDLISSRYQTPYKEKTIPSISHIANHISMSLFQMTNIIQEYSNIKLFNFRKDKWFEHLNELGLSTIEKKLLEQTFFRNEVSQSNYKYFNIDLFQSSLYNWSQSNKAGDLPTSPHIFHQYLKEHYV